jgi:hypothetical protein
MKHVFNIEIETKTRPQIMPEFEGQQQAKIIRDWKFN